MVSTNNFRSSDSCTCRFQQLSVLLIKILFNLSCVIITLSNNNNNNCCLFASGFISSATTTIPPLSSQSLSSRDIRRRRRGRSASLSLFDKQEKNDDDTINENNIPRRHFLQTLPTAALLTGSLITGTTTTPPAAHARLVQFPCNDVVGLNNRYHLMRAGQSLLEEQDIWETNPLFSTSRDAALSPRGIEQVERTCELLLAREFNPSVVKFSLAANAIDTSDIVANKLQVGRNRLVPEYTYLDPRGVGRWNQFPLGTTEAAVWAMDETEAGAAGLGGRPPATDDGTAHETLADQVTRLRQLMSLLETQCSGDDILLIFPDGTGPAVLTCLVGGIPLSRVHELEFAPGEVRFDVTYDATQGYLDASPTLNYRAVIDRGMVELNFLRSHPEVDYRRRLNSHQEAAASVPERQRVPVGTKERGVVEPRRELTSDGNMYLFGVGALGVMSVGNVMGRRNDEDEDETVLLSSSSLGVMNSNDTVADGVMTMTTEVANDDDNDPVIASMEEKIRNAPIDIPEMVMTSNNDNSDVVDAKEMLDDDDNDDDEQLMIAMKAMDDYLDQDDGGDAWRNIVSELMEDDS